LPTERHKEYTWGDVRVTVSGSLFLELAEAEVANEGISAVSVGPKKKVSSSGCAVRSKMRGALWVVLESGGKTRPKFNG
jgi:hypothetical protein